MPEGDPKLPSAPGELPEVPEPEIFQERFAAAEITKLDNRALKDHIEVLLTELGDVLTSLSGARTDLAVLEGSLARITPASEIDDPYVEGAREARALDEARAAMLRALIPRGERLRERYRAVLRKFVDAKNRPEQKPKEEEQ